MEQDIRSVTERLAFLERESLRIKRSARLAKILSAATSVLVVMVATVPKVHSLGFPLPIAATEFDLLGPGGKITAKLTTYQGGPNLLFYDNQGKLVEDAGFFNNSSLVSAGIGVLDGNALSPGKGVFREYSGVTTVNKAAPTITGEGMGTYDASGNGRVAVGETIDGSVAYALVGDPNGNYRSGIDYDAVHDFTGAFTNDAAGTNRTAIGTGTDDIDSFWQLNYSNGDIAVSGFTPPLTGNPPDVAVFDTSGAYRSVVGLEFFGAFDGSENLIAHLP
jgi:hypothetical protein